MENTFLDKEFMDCIYRLNTPKKIGAYMLENFVNRSKKGGPTVRNPYGFWKIKKGNCVDFSEFGAFVATYHGYKVYQLGIPRGNTHETSDDNICGRWRDVFYQ